MWSKIIDKMLSVRWLVTVCVIFTLCAVVVGAVAGVMYALLKKPDSFQAAKELLLVIWGVFGPIASAMGVLYFTRNDRTQGSGEAPAPASKQAGHTTLITMLVLAVLGLLCLAVPGRAADQGIPINLGITTLYVQGDINSFGMVNVLHQAENDRILTGVNTTARTYVIKNFALDLGVGVITGTANTGMPTGSLGHSWQIEPGSFLAPLNLGPVSLGVGLGVDFTSSGQGWKNVAAGVTLSANLLNLIHKGE